MSASGLQSKYFVALKESERADMLDETKWLRDWDWKMIETFSQFFDVYDFPPGYTLGLEGEQQPWLGVVCLGAIRVLKKDADGASKEICILGAGKAVGEISLIDGRPRSAELEVETKLRMLVLSKAKFDTLIQIAPEIAIKLVLKISALLSARLRATSGRLVEHLEEQENLLEK